MAQMSRLMERYQNEAVPALMEEFSYTNVMQVPRLVKAVVNVGMGDAIQDAKLLDAATATLVQITGQRPVVTRAKKSIAGFKLRAGMAVGCMVTLRRGPMYAFLDRLLNTSLPRIRDFRGLSPKAFDGHGNYSLGLREQIIFPEVDYDQVGKVHGMDVVIVTTARTDEEGRALLRALGMPFRA